MAKNDYSRRSKKDVFWGDDDNNKNSSKSDELDELFRQSEALEHQKQPTPPPHEPAYEPSYSYEPEPTYEPEPEPTYEPEPEPTFESEPEPEPETETEVDNPYFDYDSVVKDDIEPPEEEEPAPQKIVPPPYIPSQQQSTTPPPTKNKEDVLDGFNVEKFIQDNDTNFTRTIVCKVASQILCVWLLIKWALYAPYILVIIIAVGVIAKGIINWIFNSRYKDYIKSAAMSIKKVTAFNAKPQLEMPWETLLQFPYTKLLTDKEDELIIMADETKVISQEISVYHYVGKNSKEILFNCEYYMADMEGRTTFANNIIITKNKMPFIKRLKSFREVSQYVLYYDNQQDIDECNIPRVLAIAEKVSTYLGKMNFAMYFDSNNIHLVLPIPNLDKFNYNTFDYKIADRIRRDVTAIADRAYLADLLAEN